MYSAHLVQYTYHDKDPERARIYSFKEILHKLWHSPWLLPQSLIKKGGRMYFEDSRVET